MKYRIFLYTLTRVLFGIVLAANGAYNVIIYPEFLTCLESFIRKTSVFDFEFVGIFLALAPFAEFLIGLLLIMGFYTRKALIFSILLFLFIALYLLDANSEIMIFVYTVFLLMSGILLRKDNYNIHSIDYSTDLQTRI